MAVCLKSDSQQGKEIPKVAEPKTVESSEFEIALLSRNGNPVTERQPLTMGFTVSGAVNKAEIRFKTFTKRCECEAYRIHRNGKKWRDGKLSMEKCCRPGETASFLTGDVRFTLEQ